MPSEMGAEWTRRGALAALAGAVAGSGLAASRDGTKFVFADRARALAQKGPDHLDLLIPRQSGDNIAPIARDFTELTGLRLVTHEADVREIGTTLLIDQLQGKRRFDIALPPTYEIPDLVASGALAPLDDLSGFASARGLYPEALYTNGDSFDDRTYGHQTDGDVYLLILNKDVLEDEAVRRTYAEATGTEFDVPRSWQEFDRQVRFVHRTLDRPGAALIRSTGAVEWEFWLRFHAKGYWPLDLDFEPRIDSDAGREVLEDMIAIQPHIISVTDDRNFLRGWQQYQETGAYASFGWGGTQKLFRRTASSGGLRHRFAPIPGGSAPGTPASLSYFNWGWSYALVSGTNHPDLALSFINFAVTPEVSTTAVREAGGFFDPFRPEHYDDAEIREIYGADFLDVHRSELQNAIPDFYVANRGAYFETLGAWIEMALEGTVKPGVALANAADHWRLLSNDREQGDQAARWRQLRAKYPPAIANRLRDLPA